MKFPKSKLDEMQEKQRAKAEHIGFHCTAAALFLSILIQSVIILDPKNFLAEFIIFEALGIYLIIAHLKIGICGRFCKPSIKNYLIGSLISALSVWILIYLMSYIHGFMEDVFKDALIYSGATFVLCFLMTSLSGCIYKKRRQKLDSGLGYRELADAVGVTVQTLKAIENGSYVPSLKLCRAICKETGKTLDELFGEDEIHLSKETVESI